MDINDLTIVLTNYGKGGFWTDGDFNGDGKVNVNDLTIVLSNFGKTAGAGLADVPEPSSVMLLAIGAFALLLVRRKGGPKSCPPISRARAIHASQIQPDQIKSSEIQIQGHMKIQTGWQFG